MARIKHHHTKPTPIRGHSNMHDVEINPSDLDGTAVFAHSILSKAWFSHYKNEMEYGDFYAGFCLYWLTYRSKYNPSRGSPMAFTKICTFSYINRVRRKQKKGVRELVDVSVNIELDADELAIVDAWVEGKCMIKTISGLADRLNMPERTVTEILTGIQNKVAERRRTKKVVLC